MCCASSDDYVADTTKVPSFEEVQGMVESEFDVTESFVEHGVPTFHVNYREDSKEAFLRLMKRLGLAGAYSTSETERRKSCSPNQGKTAHKTQPKHNKHCTVFCNTRNSFPLRIHPVRLRHCRCTTVYWRNNGYTWVPMRWDTNYLQINTM